METEEKARILAETISEVMNGLAPLAWPERFGTFPSEHHEHLSWAVKTLRAFLGSGSGVTTSGNLDSMIALLPGLERALEMHEDVERLAREFLSAMGVDPDRLPGGLHGG